MVNARERKEVEVFICSVVVFFLFFALILAVFLVFSGFVMLVSRDGVAVCWCGS